MKVKRRFITISPLPRDNQAMLDNIEMGRRIDEAINSSGKTKVSIAKAFEISEQAITGWIRTGKVDKRKLPKLATLTGRPLSFFLPDAGDAPQSHPVELNMTILRSSIVSVKEATKKLHLQFDAYDTAPILAFAYRERSKLPLDLDKSQLKEFDKAVLMELKGEIGDEKERPASARGKGISKEAAPDVKKVGTGR